MNQALSNLHRSLEDLRLRAAAIRQSVEDLYEHIDVPAFDEDEAMRRVARAKAADVANETSTAAAVIDAVIAERLAHESALTEQRSRRDAAATLEAEHASVQAQADEAHKLYQIEMRRVCRVAGDALKARYGLAVTELASVLTEMSAIGFVSGDGHSDLGLIRQRLQLPSLGVAKPEGMREHLGAFFACDAHDPSVVARAAAIRAELLGV
jgi:hypothetical protein